MILIYIIGAYGAPTEEERKKNTDLAVQYAALLNELGDGKVRSICPHLEYYTNAVKEMPEKFWRKSDLLVLSRCDAVACIPNWKGSEGSGDELSYWMRLKGIERGTKRMLDLSSAKPEIRSALKRIIREGAE